MEKENLKAKTLNLKEIIDYQQGSVVSRQVIKKESGSLTLFAFAKGEGLSEHTAPFDALVFVLEGEVEVIISGICHRVKENQTIIMPANIPHQLKAVKNFKMLLVMIR